MVCIESPGDWQLELTLENCAGLCVCSVHCEVFRWTLSNLPLPFLANNYWNCLVNTESLLNCKLFMKYLHCLNPELSMCLIKARVLILFMWQVKKVGSVFPHPQKIGSKQFGGQTFYWGKLYHRVNLTLNQVLSAILPLKNVCSHMHVSGTLGPLW